MNANIVCLVWFGLVRFWPAQMSAVTDPGPEHFWLDDTNTKF